MATGELLNMLKKSARNGTLLSSCEPEVKEVRLLTELMHQLDVLISEHQREWAEQLKETQAQLQLRDKELTSLRISLQERTDQLERMKLQSLQQDQEHRARHADCEAQLVRVRSELSRLRHSYEQLRAKRNLQNQQKASGASSSGHGTANYKHECHSLRRQLAERKEREREMERECRELTERLKKSDEDMEGMEVERKQSQQSVVYLQETLKSREGLIRNLQQKVGVTKISASCQSELEEVKGRLSAQEVERRLKEELSSHLEVEKRLKEEANRAKKEGDHWKQQLDKVKVHQGRQESEVVRKLEERVQKLEHQLRESQRISHEGGMLSQNEAIGRFKEQVEELSGVVGGSGYVALEPIQHHPSSRERDGQTEQWSQMLENVLGKHFDQLDSSLQQMLSPH